MRMIAPTLLEVTTADGARAWYRCHVGLMYMSTQNAAVCAECIDVCALLQC